MFETEVLVNLANSVNSNPDRVRKAQTGLCSDNSMTCIHFDRWGSFERIGERHIVGLAKIDLAGQYWFILCEKRDSSLDSRMSE